MFSKVEFQNKNDNFILIKYFKFIYFLLMINNLKVVCFVLEIYVYIKFLIFYMLFFYN